VPFAARQRSQKRRRPRPQKPGVQKSALQRIVRHKRLFAPDAARLRRCLRPWVTDLPPAAPAGHQAAHDRRAVDQPPCRRRTRRRRTPVLVPVRLSSPRHGRRSTAHRGSSGRDAAPAVDRHRAHVRSPRFLANGLFCLRTLPAVGDGATAPATSVRTMMPRSARKAEPAACRDGRIWRH